MQYKNKLVLLIITALFGILNIGGLACAKDLGLLMPQKALEYMKANNDLIIVDTALPGNPPAK